MDPNEIARLRELCEKATPGPWNRGTGNEYRELFKNHGMHLAHVYECADGDFIAAARTALPALLDEVERLQEIAELAHRQMQDGDALYAKVAALEAALARLHALLTPELLRRAAGYAAALQTCRICDLCAVAEAIVWKPRRRR